MAGVLVPKLHLRWVPSSNFLQKFLMELACFWGTLCIALYQHFPEENFTPGNVWLTQLGSFHLPFAYMNCKFFFPVPVHDLIYMVYFWQIIYVTTPSLWACYWIFKNCLSQIFWINRIAWTQVWSQILKAYCCQCK